MFVYVFSFFEKTVKKVDNFVRIVLFPTLVLFDVSLKVGNYGINIGILINKLFVINSTLIGVFSLHEQCRFSPKIPVFFFI